MDAELLALERFLVNASFAETASRIFVFTEWLDDRARERFSTAYGMEREGMSAAAIVVHAQGKGFSDARAQLLKIMHDDGAPMHDTEVPECAQESTAA